MGIRIFQITPFSIPVNLCQCAVLGPNTMPSCQQCLLLFWTTHPRRLGPTTMPLSYHVSRSRLCFGLLSGGKRCLHPLSSELQVEASDCYHGLVAFRRIVSTELLPRLPRRRTFFTHKAEKARHSVTGESVTIYSSSIVHAPASWAFLFRTIKTSLQVKRTMVVAATLL